MNPPPLRGPLAHCVRSARVIGKPLGTLLEASRRKLK